MPEKTFRPIEVVNYLARYNPFPERALEALPKWLLRKGIEIEEVTVRKDSTSESSPRKDSPTSIDQIQSFEKGLGQLESLIVRRITNDSPAIRFFEPQTGNTSLGTEDWDGTSLELEPPLRNLSRRPESESGGSDPSYEQAAIEAQGESLWRRWTKLMLGD